MIKLVTVASVLAATQKPPVSIDTRDDGAMANWASRLGVGREQLTAAIAEVGPSIAAVRGYLSRPAAPASDRPGILA